MTCFHAERRAYYHPVIGRTHSPVEGRALTKTMCADCAERANGLGADWRIDNRTAPRVERRNLDTRPFVPEWLRRGTGKDLTGSAA